VEQLKPRRSTFRSNVGDSDPTRKSLSQIARFDTWPDWLVLYGTVVVADAVDSLVTSLAKSETERFINQRRGEVGRVLLTVRYPWYERERERERW
jgi:hypothetical protein